MVTSPDSKVCAYDTAKFWNQTTALQTFVFSTSPFYVLETFQGLESRREEIKQKMRGSNIADSKTGESAAKVNITLAIFTSDFLHLPVIRVGHTNTCYDLGKTSLTSHSCSTATFAKARGGHQTHFPFGL